MKGMIVFSFALSREEPNPCNRRLGEIASDIVRDETDRVLVVSQWEILRALHRRIEPVVICGHHSSTGYLSSEEIVAQAAEIFRGYGIRDVIVVANPFLHLRKCRYLVRRSGFAVLKRKIPWVGFYPESIQWWTRGPMRLCIYAFWQGVTKAWAW